MSRGPGCHAICIPAKWVIYFHPGARSSSRMKFRCQGTWTYSIILYLYISINYSFVTKIFLQKKIESAKARWTRIIRASKFCGYQQAEPAFSICHTCRLLWQLYCRTVWNPSSCFEFFEQFRLRGYVKYFRKIYDYVEGLRQKIMINGYRNKSPLFLIELILR